MRRINKHPEPKWLADWKKSFKAENGREATYDDLEYGNRQKLREELVSEQGFIGSMKPCLNLLVRELKNHSATE